jgi:hypothetical protein
MTPDRVITLTRPDGVVHFVGSTVDRVPAPIRRMTRDSVPRRRVPCPA